MRIELPAAPWADTAPRAEDDAHTLTMAAQPALEWAPWQWPAEPAPALRTHVPASQPVTLTITL